MEKKEKGCVDLAKTLGRSFISGAYDIERRVHWSAFIYTEWSHYDNELYLEIHREKVKYKKTPVDYMVHWLQNGFIIHDDYGTTEYLSRDTIMPKEDNFAQGASDVGTRGITSIARMKADMGIEQPSKETNKATDVPKPMTFEEEMTPISQNDIGKIPILISPSIFNFGYYSFEVPRIFEQANPYELTNYVINKQFNDGSKSSYVMPDKCYGVTPFNI